MIIHYVVLTCSKYSDRRESIEKTWLRGQEFTFLSDQYGIPEEYLKVSLKYISYFRDIRNIKHDVDWYYFVDDDTHIYPQKLEAYLSKLDGTYPVATGYHLRFEQGPDYKELYGENCSVHPSGLDYLAGGVGFAVSRSAALKIFSYLFIHPNPPWSIFGDVSFGLWFRDTGVRLIYVDAQLFGTENAKLSDHSSEQIKMRYAYHYVPPQEQEWMYSLR
jgi:Galactosyltransferase